VSIGVVVIAENEADRIGMLLDSVPFADEVIVVDSGSTDATCEICKAKGARVIHNPWPGYAAQKQFALECAGSDWILNLDADESVSPQLAAEIQTTLKKAPPEVNAWSIPRLSRYLGRWIRHEGWYPDRKVRLVRRGKGLWNGDGLHEQLSVQGKTGSLTYPIHHRVYRNISDQLHTIDTYSGIYANGRPPSGGWFVTAGVLHAIGKFLECFIWKKGMLDGIPGLIIAMNSAWYVFLKHAKVWESGLKKPDFHP